MLAGGVAVAAQHAGEFGDARRFLEALDLRNSAAVLDLFEDDEMGRGGGGDGREVGDAEHLMLPGDLAHFVADGVGGFAADVGIDLIEDQHGHLVFAGEDGLEGEHHPRHFAGGGDGAERACGFAGVGCELKLDDVQTRAGRAKIGVGEFLGADAFERDVKLALLKAEVFKLARGGFGEFRDDFAAARGEVGAGAPEFSFHLVERGVEAREFGLALFEAGEFAAGLVAERDDVGERAAVFAFERVEEVQALFHFLKPGRIDFDAVGVAGEDGLQIVQRAGGAFVRLRERRGGGIDALDFLKQPADGAELGEEGIVVFAEQIERALRKLEEARAVAGAVKFLFERGFFVGVKFGSGDLGGLVAEEFELLRVGAVVDDERGLFGFEFDAATDELGEEFALGDEAAEGIENGELSRGLEE